MPRPISLTDTMHLDPSSLALSGRSGAQSALTGVISVNEVGVAGMPCTGLRTEHGAANCAGFNQQLGLSNELFVLGDSVVLTALGQVSFMPILVLAARLCPEVRTSFAYLLILFDEKLLIGSAPLLGGTPPSASRSLWHDMEN